MAHTLNDEPYGIQACMYEPESEPEWESEEAEMVEETRLQQNVSEWYFGFFSPLTFSFRVSVFSPCL